jgi:hypothetical protein
MRSVVGVYSVALTLLFSWSFAQQVNLPKPSGPVVEVVSETLNATLRLQGCARDQEDKVVCSLQIQSNARTNQQVTVQHQSIRAISARGFSYPGYLSVEGGQLDAARSTFALPAGNRAVGKLVFPAVPKEESFLTVVYLGGVELRGIPIGQAQAPQVQAPAQGPSAPAGGVWDYKKFTVGPFTFELKEGPIVDCCTKMIFVYSVTASQDAKLQMRFNGTRTIFSGGWQRTDGSFGVAGGRTDFLAGIPLNTWVYLYAPDQARGSDQILYTEFEVFDGKDWQKVVFRNVPIQK